MDSVMFEQLRWAALQFIILLVAISLHEYGHAKAADLRGDPLPRAQGRVTLNPVVHWDMIGTLVIPGLMIFLPILLNWHMPIALLGWGKPVQVSLPNPKTRKWDDILITLAGPMMNLVQALFASVALGLAILMLPRKELTPESMPGVLKFFTLAIYLNCILAVFNMMPIPPLDGSRVARRVLGISDETFNAMARYSFFVLLVLINTPFLDVVVMPIVTLLAEPFLMLADFIAKLGGK
jgi:Zn-dependent protease